MAQRKNVNIYLGCIFILTIKELDEYCSWV